VAQLHERDDDDDDDDDENDSLKLAARPSGTVGI